MKHLLRDCSGDPASAMERVLTWSVLFLVAVFNPHISNSGDVSTSERMTGSGRKPGQKIGRLTGNPVVSFVWIGNVGCSL